MKLKANRDTFLKKSTAPANDLPDDEKRLISAEDDIAVQKQLQEKEGHVQVRLSYGAGDWWYFKDHFSNAQIVSSQKQEVKPTPPKPLEREENEEVQIGVPYYSQLDNYRDPYRTCFSSSCAMLLSTLRPGQIRSDDDYLKTVVWLGGQNGTINPYIQISALKEHGVQATYQQDLTWDDIWNQLEKRIPIPIGILHQGHVSNPIGFGHWIIIIGCSADRKNVLVHDPFGDLDLVDGEYVSSNGRTKWYSVKNLEPRWHVGEGQGWGIIATR